MKFMSSSPNKIKKVFVSDCEGPISKNDNAFELTSHFVPKGSRLFTLTSRYDDVLAEIVKRPGYKAGDTLKLILPFLKAHGVTNKAIMDYSSQNVLLVPGVKETLHFIRSFMPCFIVSTSYEQYMRVLCNLVDFPFANVYCTQLNLDKYKADDEEKNKLKEFAEKMGELPVPEIPKNAKTLEDLPIDQQETIKRLDEIFWKQLLKMKAGRILKEVNPMGGVEKAQAIQGIVTKLKSSVHKVMYVGDSITDVEAFRMVREGGGLTVSFNGNAYAVREAEIAVMSENTVVIAVLADIFNRFGKNEIMKFVSDWNPSALEKFGLTSSFKERFFELCREKFPVVEAVTSENRDELMKQSSSFRKRVRGEPIGKLG